MHGEKYTRLKAAIEALKGVDASQELVRELIYASGDALRQGAALTTDEIEEILSGLPTNLDLVED